MAKGKYQRWLEPDGLLLLEGWARDGLTDEQLAGKMGINPATLYDWKNKYPKISEALKKGQGSCGHTSRKCTVKARTWV